MSQSESVSMGSFCLAVRREQINHDATNEARVSLRSHSLWPRLSCSVIELSWGF